MVSFRFYLVSITALFLALAVGITMGATFIDRATVDLLRTQIKTAQGQRSATQAQNKILGDQISERRDFENNVAPLIVGGALTGVPVVVIDVQGAGLGSSVEDVNKILHDAGANVQAQIDLTKALALDKGDDTVTKLASQLGLTGSLQADDVRKNALTTLAQWLASPTPAPAEGNAKTPLDAMKGMGLVQVTQNAAISASARFVVVSSATPDVPNEDVAIPFTTALALQTGGRVLAAEPGQLAQPQAEPPVPALREVFVAPLRTDGTLKGKLSTVDNLEDVYGRVAVVYAVRNLGTLLVGHYGLGSHASDGLLPKS